MLLSPLYKVFRNVAKPEKVFRKQFIAAALVGFTVSYGAAGAIVYSAAKSEWNSGKEFNLSDLISIKLIKKHGLKGGAALGLSYAGDATIIYALAGMAYWRSRKNKDASPAPAPDQ